MENWMKSNKSSRVSPKRSSKLFWSGPSSAPRKQMSYHQAKTRYPKLNPYGDADKDKVPNWLDCKPFNKRKQGWAHKGTTFEREQSTYVKMMTPEKFLRTTYREVRLRPNRYSIQPSSEFEESKSVSPEGLKEYSRQVIDKENVERLKKVIRSRQGKMQVPFLEYDEQGYPIGHEGRHRATAAMETGVKLIPVTIARKLKEPRDWEAARERYHYKKTKHEWKNVLENEPEVISSKSADIPIQEQREYGEEKPQSLQSLDNDGSMTDDKVEDSYEEPDEYKKE